MVWSPRWRRSCPAAKAPGSAGPVLPDVTLEPTTTDGLSLHPVTLTAEDVDRYYEGFSNETLWPLYHDAVVESQFHRDWWEAYQRVNARFADAAAELAAPGATVWVHDYQLQLVPQLLRRLRPDVRIGFFLHIPFPPVELFMRLPWRTQIVNGLLGADLIGFQLPGGARNFARLAKSLTGAVTTGGTIEHDGRTIRAAAYPIAIDSAEQSALAATPRIHDAAKQLRDDLGKPSKIILGVDRLDYTKGIDVRLRAFGELLAEGDPAVENAVMVQIATPSRERLGSYKRMREAIEQQVGSLNGDYGKIGHPAVHYLHQSLPREELAAFYVAADVMTVTPLRDGMNLVAKEYVACRVDGGGVLLLSEFTGAAKELRAGLLVNPYDTDGVKDGLRAALTMPTVEARRRMRSLRRQVLTHDVDRWAAAFLSALERTRDHVADAMARLPNEVVAALAEISETQRLLVATDFDGCLAPIVDDPGHGQADPGVDGGAALAGRHPRHDRGRGLRAGPGRPGAPARPGGADAPGGLARRRDLGRGPGRGDRVVRRGFQAARPAAAGIAADHRGVPRRAARAQAHRDCRTPARDGPRRCRGRHQPDRGEPGQVAGRAPAARQDGPRTHRGDHQQGPRTQGPDEGQPLHRNGFHRRRHHRRECLRGAGRRRRRDQGRLGSHRRRCADRRPEPGRRCAECAGGQPSSGPEETLAARRWHVWTCGQGADGGHFGRLMNTVCHVR